jgi:signal transduction histidine kinase
VRPRFADAGVRFSTEIAADLPVVSGDFDALVTVVVNLLDNAYKYTEDDKEIMLRTYAQDGAVCFEVEDNGIGLSRRAAKRIFDRFFQVDQSLHRRAEGCGLGLSIVQFIVDAHHGSIGVRSEPGTGSTFTVRIPAAAARESG